MQVIKGVLHNHHQRDSYWTRVVLRSEKSQETSLIVCASHEFLSQQLNTNDVTSVAVNGWLDNVVKEWEEKDESVFQKPVHLDIRTITDDGYENTIEFLTKEVIPQYS